MGHIVSVTFPFQSYGLFMLGRAVESKILPPLLIVIIIIMIIIISPN